MPTLKVFHRYSDTNTPTHKITIPITKEFMELSKEDFELFLQEKREELEKYYQHLKCVRVYLCIKSKIE